MSLPLARIVADLEGGDHSLPRLYVEAARRNVVRAADMLAREADHACPQPAAEQDFIDRALEEWLEVVRRNPDFDAG